MGKIWQNRARTGLSAVVIAACLSIALIGIAFPVITSGLVSHIDPSGALVFCREISGSGNEADVVMPFLGVFLVPALIRLRRHRKHIAIIEIVLVPIPIYITIMMLAVAGCGAGSDHDAYTAMPWFRIINVCLVLYPLAVFLMMLVRWPKLILP